jgi:ubiquinone/menaquinone biosynthesis C-methylase UbiE
VLVLAGAVLIGSAAVRGLPSDPAVTLFPAPPSPPAHPALPAHPAQTARPASPALTPQQLLRPQSKSKPKLFDPLDLGLLESPDRDQWQKPELIMDELLIAEGSAVAEIGAGGGWFTVRLARRVGPNGVVYAEDIQPEMIEAMRLHLQHEHLTNVKPILGTKNDPRLPAMVDAVLTVETFREMADLADPVELLNNVAKSLKPQGRIGIVDFKPGGGGPGPAPDERVPPEKVIAAATAAGLRLVKHVEVPPFMYLLVFGRNRIG